MSFPMKKVFVLIAVAAASLAHAAPVTPIYLGDHGVPEGSGITASRQHPGVYWMHPDSNHPAVVYAVSEQGQIIRVVDVTGATNSDWEDIAIDASGNLWIGEIGGGRGTLYRIPEPDPNGSGASAPAEVFLFDYPESVQDCESLFVAGELPHLIQKRPLNARVFGYPSTPIRDVDTMLEFVGEFDNSGFWITGADISSDGRRLALVSDSANWHWVIERAAGSNDASDFFTSPTNVWRADFDNGGSGSGGAEAITFRAGTYDFIVANEQGDMWLVTQEMYEGGGSTSPPDAPQNLRVAP
ncbi:MAG: hypothetical protein R3344_07630 [Acidobacteriota bacterium]|nr:hypothetical protein [Acidobacteriota bacterium]